MATGSTPTSTTSSTNLELGGLTTPARLYPSGHGHAGGTPISVQQLFATVNTESGQLIVPLSEQQDPLSTATITVGSSALTDPNAANADLVPNEEYHAGRLFHQPQTPHNTRSTHKPRSPLKDKPQDQHKTMSSRGKSSKEREQERHKLVDLYQTAIDEGCQIVRQAIDAAPDVPLGRDPELSLDDNLFNNELAYQLWGSHLDRILGLKEELNYHVNLWDDMVSSQTAVFVRECEGATKAAFLGKQDGYSELVAEFDAHLREVDEAKARSATAIGYYKALQSKSLPARPTESSNGSHVEHSLPTTQDLPSTTTSARAATYYVSTVSAPTSTAFTVTTTTAGTSVLSAQMQPGVNAAANSDQPFNFGFSLPANAHTTTTNVVTTGSTSQPVDTAFGEHATFVARLNRPLSWGLPYFNTCSTNEQEEFVEEDDYVISHGSSTTVHWPEKSSYSTRSTTTNQASANASKNRVHFADKPQVLEFNAPPPPLFSTSVPATSQTQPVQPTVQQTSTAPPSHQQAPQGIQMADIAALVQTGRTNMTQAMMQMQTQMAEQQTTLQTSMMEKQMALMGNMMQNMLYQMQQQQQDLQAQFLAAPRVTAASSVNQSKTGGGNPPVSNANATPPPPVTTAQRINALGPQPRPTAAQQAPQPMATSSVPPQAQPPSATGFTPQAQLMRNLVASAAQQGNSTTGGYRSFLRDADADFNCGDTPRAPLVRPPEPQPFRGAIEDWPRFYEEWNYYSDQVLPDDIQRMRLLKRLLEGQANDMAGYYRDTSQDYHDLMESLTKRYDQPEAIANILNAKLRAIPNPHRETAKELRDLHNKLNAVCRQLKSSGCDVNHRLYLELVMAKLPEQLLRELKKTQMRTPPCEWNTFKVLGLIEEYVREFEYIQYSKETHSEASHPPQQNKLNRGYNGQQNKLNNFNNGRRVFATQVVESEEEDNTSVTSEVPPKRTPQVHVHFHNTGTDGKPMATAGRVPPKGRHNSDRPSNKPKVQPPRRPCVFCDSLRHFSFECHRYPTSAKRRERLQKLERCTKCVQKGHTKRNDCPQKSRQCRRCGSDIHHPLICSRIDVKSADNKLDKNKLHNKQAQRRVMFVQEDAEPTESEGEDTSSERAFGSDVEYDSADDFDYPPGYVVNTVTTTDHTVMGTSSDVERSLLMTTMVDVSNPEVPNQRYACPVFFDQGSTTTLITKDLARKLNLPIREEKVATFHGFGDKAEGKQVPCWTVDLEIHLQAGGRLRLTAEAVDSFCAPMTALADPREVVNRILRQPNMAPPATITTPQIIIGTDYLGEFDVIRRKKKLPNGFFVYDSLVGPLLSGKGKVSWKKDQQDRPQINLIYKLDVDNRPQDPHKLNLVERDQLLEATEKMWKTEAIGIESPEAPKAQENERVLKQFLETLVQLADGRYEVSFPFKEEILEALKAGMKPSLILPTNKKAACARLDSVWKSYFKENPQVRETYAQAFAEQLARGIIELVDMEQDTEGLIHYLAHHPVFREDKPTKLRVVFDGSARSGPGSRSLNDCLLTGPSLLESLIGILLRRRLSPLLIIGDIEKAFLQISIRLDDRDVTRFLWLKDLSKPPTTDNLVCYRYCRVPFGLNASPFLLLATVQTHLNKLNSPLTEEIKANSYSDNVFLYAQNTEEAVAKYKEAKGAFSKAQMNVREFISDSPDFNNAVLEADRAKETKEKTLGHQWCSQRDVWTFTLPDPTPYKLNQPVDDKIDSTSSTDPELALQEGKDDHQVMLCRKVKKAKYLTKRVMLSGIHSLWDPLNVLGPVTLQARLKYQSLFDTDLGWDQQVPEASVRTWEEVTASWANAQFEVDRFLFHGGRPKSVQLHVFVDASDDAYGAVAYLRVEPETGSTYCVLLFGKNRVADRKVKLSIPRKELLAAVVGCRVIDFLRKEMLPEFYRQYKLNPVSTYLWGDNQGVLYWIKDSDHTYGRFVQNRLEEIRRTADVEFRYIPTKDNPADVLSRGATADELKGHHLWWSASPWLKEEEKLWPTQPVSFQPFSQEILGLDAKPPKEIMSFGLQQDLLMSHALQQAQLKELFDDIRRTLTRSVRTYPRIRRITVNVLRFAGAMLRTQGRELRLPFLKPFTRAGAEEYSQHSQRYLYMLRWNAAELALVWNTQQVHPPTKNQCTQFNVVKAPDGLLRCKGRLVNSGLPSNTINPVWLPEKTWIVRYLVHTLHVLHAHSSVETTLASLRRRFWLVKGRRHVKTIIRNNCVGCRLAHGPAFRIPDFANLSLERLRKSRPFTHIGLDLFGPIQVRMGLKSQPVQYQPQAQPRRRGRKPQRRHKEAPADLQKVWGVIFTCMAVRAVHLEVVHSLSAEHLLQAFDRFMSRRGQPRSVTSDNAPSIILVNRTIDEMFKRALNDRTVEAYNQRQGIEWHYITPESPWQGGFYERLIRSVKRCLTSAIGHSRLYLSHFTQLLARVEHTLNCRPLTHQSVGDLDTVPLRPIDFLQPLADPGEQDVHPEPEDEDEDYEERTPAEVQLLKLFGNQQAQLEKFWERWRAEYLPSLRETQRALKQSGRVDRIPEVGEFVLVDDDELLPRAHWKFARVMELIPGRDGTIRHVRLKFPGGAEADRAVHQLCPFELNLSDEEAETQQNPLDN